VSVDAHVRAIRKAMAAVMRERGLSPKRWEAEAGVASRVVGKFLSGARGDIQLRSLIKLARAADVGLEKLLGL